MTPIKYIGKRPEHIDGAYATRIHWKQGETKPVPDDVAVKMLRHTDVFTLGDGSVQAIALTAAEAETAERERTKSEESKKEDNIQNLRDSVANMDKDALANFAQTHFSAKLDSRASVEKLRERVTTMIDQYGIE